MKNGKNTVGIISPAGFAAPERLQDGIGALESMGFGVKVMPNVNCGSLHPYISGTPEMRAADLMQAWLDDEVDLLWAFRGGYGSAEILDLLDWSRLGQRPDMTLIGFSDITSLHFAMCRKNIGRPAVAPMVWVLPDALKNDFTRKTLLEIFDAPVKTDCIYGNLTVAASLCGTGYLPDVRNKTVILEDINEPVHRMDRCLNQLYMNGFFKGIAGLRFGQFTGCGDGPDDVKALQKRWLNKLNLKETEKIAYGHELTFECARFWR